MVHSRLDSVHRSPSITSKKSATDQALWDSAVQHLTNPINTFEVKPWREIVDAQFIKSGRRATDPIIRVKVAKPPEGISMPNANAKVKKDAEKAATKKLASNGTHKPKHVPGEAAPGIKAAWPGADTPKSGVDNAGVAVVHSGVSSDNTTQEKSMTTETIKPTDVAKVPAGVAGSRTDPEKQKLKDEAHAKMAAEKAEKAKKTEAEKAAAKADREQKALAAKGEREQKASATLAAKMAAAEGTKRTYFGSMTALAERVKNGQYTKGLTGQLRSSDELAIALDAVPTDNVIKLGLLVLGLETNPYAALNRGQQSMNLRNKMRGAIKANEGKGLVIGDHTVTLDYIKSVRDANGFATAEDEAAKRKAAKDKTANERAALKAAKDLAKAAEAQKKAEAAKATPAATPQAAA